MTVKKIVVEKLKHFIKELPSGWIRENNGASATAKKITDAYLGKSQFGGDLIQTIVDTRASFIVGQGLRLNIKVLNSEGEADYSKELQFINDVFSYNRIDELIQQIAVSIELEGKLLAGLEKLNNEKIYNIKLFPYVLYNYKLEQDKDDLQVIKKVMYKNLDGQEETLEKDEFVFQVFGSSLWWSPETARGRISSVYESIINLDKSSLDWRCINHLYASPTPVFKCEDQNEVSALNSALVDQKWHIGKMVVTTAGFEIHQIDTTSSDNIQKEIISLIERISGSSGVPVLMLGHTALLSNRATAMALFDVLDISVSKERYNLNLWFNDLIRLLLERSNKDFNTNFRTDVIEAELLKPAILDIEGSRLDKLITLHDKGALSLKTLLTYVPEVEDAEKEVIRIKADKRNLMNDQDLIKNISSESSATIDALTNSLAGIVLEKASKDINLGE